MAGAGATRHTTRLIPSREEGPVAGVGGASDFERGFKDGDPVRLRNAAHALLSSDADIPCMRHPLGFFHLLASSVGAVSLRLHYWPATDRPDMIAATPFHDHVWALRSCVLVGEVRNCLVSPEGDDEGEYCIATIEQVSGVDTVVPTIGLVSLKPISDDLYRVGQIYGIEPRVFHYTEVSSATAAITLVRAEVVGEGGPRTLLPAGASAHSPKRTYSDASEAARVRRDVLGLLA